MTAVDINDVGRVVGKLLVRIDRQKHRSNIRLQMKKMRNEISGQALSQEDFYEWCKEKGVPSLVLWLENGKLGDAFFAQP